MKTITILGTGYVGLTTAVLFAECGFTVYALDVNQERLDAIRAGKSFFYEEGMDALVSRGINSGKLIPTDSYEKAIPDSDFIFSCVGTPDNPDGSSNLAYVFSAAEEAVKHARPSAIYIQKSTVPVGTGEKVEALFAKHQKPLVYLSNPEFLREGTAIADTLWFDRVVVGSDNKQACEAVMDLYKEVQRHRDQIAKHAGLHEPDTGSKDEYIMTSRNSAELIKVTANAFLALKISFANSIAKLADQTGADVVEVMQAVGADRRIGKAFLNAGRGYGGGCFPKDVSGLISSSRQFNIEPSLMNAVQDVNESMPFYVIEKMKSACKDIKLKKIAVLGLAFKPGTSDVRKSPGIKIANVLAQDKNNYSVSAYDPWANEEAKSDLLTSIRICQSLEECVDDVDCVLITTDWPEFKGIDTINLHNLVNKVVIDAVNCTELSELRNRGVKVTGIGRG